MPYLLAAIAAALGVLGVVAGGADDSPGLQGLGGLLVLGGLALCVRTARRPRP